MLEFIKKHGEIFTILGLLIFCSLIYFVGLGSYRLMDVDETRYVLMSRDMFHTHDFMTLYLNGEYFFEKPPLYFWGEVLSFFTFGHISEFTARFPAALYGTFSTLLLYFVGRKVVSRKYGIVSALILATSVEFLILAKYAILDILLATCVEFAICFGFLTYFVKDNNKKYCWWAFYLFTGLAVLAKGIPGIALPVATMFFASVFTKKFKEIFRPQYILPGAIMFLAIVLPWHIIMLKTHNPLFYNEYIIKHHLARFLDSSNGVNREEPFYYFLITFLCGFFPWIISAFGILIAKLKQLKTKPFLFDLAEMTNVQKYLLFNFIAFVVTMLFFSSSSTKLATYILPIYFAAASLMAWGWVQYLDSGKYEKPIQITSYIIYGLFLFLSVASIIVPIFLPEKIVSVIAPVKWFTIGLLFISGTIGLFATIKKQRTLIFGTLVGFITVLSAFGIPKYFELDYSFGQNDLMEYGQYAKENNLSIITVEMGKRYSLNYYGPKEVTYGEFELSELQNRLNNSDEKTIFIIRNKKLAKLENLKYTKIKEGAKYTLLKK